MFLSIMFLYNQPHFDFTTVFLYFGMRITLVLVKKPSYFKQKKQVFFSFAIFNFFFNLFNVNSIANEIFLFVCCGQSVVTAYLKVIC